MRKKPVVFTVETPPVSWARAGRNGRFSYTPTKVKIYESLIRHAFQESVGLHWEPWDGPVVVSVICGFKRTKTGKNVSYAIRNDVDNLLKAVSDALNGVAYADDRQIVSCHCQKSYTDAPFVTVMIHFRKGG